MLIMLKINQILNKIKIFKQRKKKHSILEMCFRTICINRTQLRKILIKIKYKIKVNIFVQIAMSKVFIIILRILECKILQIQLLRIHCLTKIYFIKN
jgi:hypothetical protein